MTTAIIGVGKIGTTVGRYLVNGGERVILASHGAGQAEAMAKELGKNARAATVEQAINDADVVVFAVWFDTIKELISQHARLLEGKVVRRRLRQHQTEKVAQCKRISSPPGDRAFRVQAFEVADQQQPEVAPWRQPWPALIRVESLAESFDVGIEVMLVENLIQSRIERMRGTPRQVLCGHPH